MCRNIRCVKSTIKYKTNVDKIQDNDENGTFFWHLTGPKSAFFSFASQRLNCKWVKKIIIFNLFEELRILKLILEKIVHATYIPLLEKLLSYDSLTIFQLDKLLKTTRALQKSKLPRMIPRKMNCLEKYPILPKT